MKVQTKIILTATIGVSLICLNHELFGVEIIHFTNWITSLIFCILIWFLCGAFHSIQTEQCKHTWESVKDFDVSWCSPYYYECKKCGAKKGKKDFK